MEKQSQFTPPVYTNATTMCLAMFGMFVGLMGHLVIITQYRIYFWIASIIFLICFFIYAKAVKRLP